MLDFLTGYCKQDVIASNIDTAVKQCTKRNHSYVRDRVATCQNMREGEQDPIRAGLKITSATATGLGRESAAISLIESTSAEKERQDRTLLP